MIDRSTVRRQVEDFWRSLLLRSRQHGEAHPKMDRDEAWRLSQELAGNLSRRFEEHNQAAAATMPPDEAQAFLEMIDEEDSICFEEHQRDPDALYRRLCINLSSNPQPTAAVAYRRQGLGRLAVRTAVRATVWESIWSLFRR